MDVGPVGGEQAAVLGFQGFEPDLQPLDAFGVGVPDGAVVGAVPCPVDAIEYNDPALAEFIEHTTGPLCITLHRSCYVIDHFALLWVLIMLELGH